MSYSHHFESHFESIYQFSQIPRARKCQIVIKVYNERETTKLAKTHGLLPSGLTNSPSEKGNCKTYISV